MKVFRVAAVAFILPLISACTANDRSNSEAEEPLEINVMLLPIAEAEPGEESY